MVRAVGPIRSSRLCLFKQACEFHGKKNPAYSELAWSCRDVSQILPAIRISLFVYLVG